MDTSTLSWVWADRPTVPLLGVTVAIAEKGTPGYRYYHRSPDGTWLLIAVAADDAEAVCWFNHRIDPTVVPADLAVWLDSVLA
ncbi:hypothetical protein MED01_002455 [Micromonospora sp. MED01]|uniref:hypothetical protein n=1 Tax=Micromonospora alfalfae TaxID=2911212 RepID=UPI001EE7E912|nr:hypothetical protein [Micromonospora alfalfae]MCG5464289.1 hypothetical protein [Micromonospora alfalfae]